jgi:hypothetical protein
MRLRRRLSHQRLGSRAVFLKEARSTPDTVNFFAPKNSSKFWPGGRVSMLDSSSREQPEDGRACVLEFRKFPKRAAHFFFSPPCSATVYYSSFFCSRQSLPFKIYISTQIASFRRPWERSAARLEAMMVEKFDNIEAHLANLQTKQKPGFLITFGGADNTKALDELREAALETSAEFKALSAEIKALSAENKANAVETKNLNGIFNTIILAFSFAILSPTFGIVLQSYLVPMLKDQHR